MSIAMPMFIWERRIRRGGDVEVEVEVVVGVSTRALRMG